MFEEIGVHGWLRAQHCMSKRKGGPGRVFGESRME